MFSAARGEGARCDGRPLRVNDPVPLARALIATGFSYDPGHRDRQARAVAALLPRIRDIRRAGGAALDLCAVASVGSTATTRTPRRGGTGPQGTDRA